MNFKEKTLTPTVVDTTTPATTTTSTIRWTTTSTIRWTTTRPSTSRVARPWTTWDIAGIRIVIIVTWDSPCFTFRRTFATTHFYNPYKKKKIFLF
jgi:hypothetical protein